MLSINTFFTEMDVSFQNVNHALIFVILLDLSIQSCSKAVPKAKSCSRLLKSKKVAQNAKSCSKVAEHNLFRPSDISCTERDFKTEKFHRKWTCGDAKTFKSLFSRD